MDNSLSDFLHSFTKVSKKPYEFLSVQEEAAETIKPLIKQIYDYTKLHEVLKYKSALPKLIVDQFDEEQIWQQLELQNGSCTNDVIESVPKLCAKNQKLEFPVKLKSKRKKTSEQRESAKQINETNNDTEELNITDVDDKFEDREIEDGIGGDLEDEDYEEDLFEDSSKGNESEKAHRKKGKLKPSVVDDKFFKLSELELFLQNEEKNQDKPGQVNDTIDLFNSVDDEKTTYKYSDFFEDPEDEPKFKKNLELEDEEEDLDISKNDSVFENNADETEEKSRVKISKRKRVDEEGEDPDTEDEEKDDDAVKKKRVRFDLLGSDESDDNTSENSKNSPTAKKKSKEKSESMIKSSLEQRQERLGRMIEKLEEEALSKKPWQLTGEVSATARPQNSLLEEAVDFDLSVRPAPIITGEVSLRLEDIIIQRIKDKAWDDVERKVKPVDTPSEFKKKLALDQEKSKLSLAEVYEQEFVKQREAATADDTERQETEPPLHTEVRSLLSSLFNKLDALSNYHYTPRPVVPELKVVSNVAAISMEEVAPVAITDSMLLAPEEIKGKKRKSLLMSKEERTDTDKKRARRLKKTRQRQRLREKAKAGKETTKINAGLGIKFGKKKGEKQVTNTTGNNKITKMEENKEKSIRSSSAFFNKLQDEVKSQIKNKTFFAKKKDKQNITAKKLKL